MIETAMRLFITQGFEHTPTSQIAREAKVATGTLFHYFKTKEDLINEIYLVTKSAYTRNLFNGVREIVDVKEKCIKLLTNAVSWSIAHEKHFLFHRLYESSPIITEKTKEMGLTHFQEFFSFIEEAKGNGIIKDIPTDMLFRILQGIMFHLIHHIIDTGLQAYQEKYIEMTFDILWEGLKKQNDKR